MAIGPRLPDSVVALDNDVLNAWRTGSPIILSAINSYISVVKAPPALTSVTVFEMMHGFEKAAVKFGMSDRLSRDREYAKELTKECAILSFTPEAAEIAGHIFPRISQKDRNEHWADIFIAATVLAHDYGIATRNKTDFDLLAKHTPPNYLPLRIEVWK